MNVKYFAIVFSLAVSGCGTFKSPSTTASVISDAQNKNSLDHTELVPTECSIIIKNGKFEIFEGNNLDSAYWLPQIATVRLRSLVEQKRCHSDDQWKNRSCEIGQRGEKFECLIDGKVFADADTRQFAELYIKWASDEGFCKKQI